MLFCSLIQHELCPASIMSTCTAPFLTSCTLPCPPCCIDPLQVLREIDNATKAFPNAYIRMCAFDASRQVQVASMLVHRPASAKEWRP